MRIRTEPKPERWIAVQVEEVETHSDGHVFVIRLTVRRWRAVHVDYLPERDTFFGVPATEVRPTALGPVGTVDITDRLTPSQYQAIRTGAIVEVPERDVTWEEN